MVKRSHLIIKKSSLNRNNITKKSFKPYKKTKKLKTTDIFLNRNNNIDNK